MATFNHQRAALLGGQHPVPVGLQDVLFIIHHILSAEQLRVPD
jgi:hypothetical protein